MQNQTSPKPNHLKVIVVSITIVLDGIAFAFVGFLYSVMMLIMDPYDLDVNIKYAYIRQGQIVFLVSLIFLLICVFLAIFWKKEKRFWVYFVSGLSILSLIVTGLLGLGLLAMGLSGGSFPGYGILITILSLILAGLNVFVLNFIFPHNAA